MSLKIIDNYFGQDRMFHWRDLLPFRSQCSIRNYISTYKQGNEDIYIFVQRDGQTFLAKGQIVNI